jgi:hypothetical protein
MRQLADAADWQEFTDHEGTYRCYTPNHRHGAAFLPRRALGLPWPLDGVGHRWHIWGRDQDTGPATWYATATHGGIGLLIPAGWLRDVIHSGIRYRSPDDRAAFGRFPASKRRAPLRTALGERLARHGRRRWQRTEVVADGLHNRHPPCR